MSNEIATFIEQFTAQYAPLYRASAAATWRANTTGEEEAFAEKARLTKEVRTLFANAQAFAQLSAWHEGPPPADPQIRRQLELLYLSHLAGQKDPATIEALTQAEKEISQKFINFRAEVDGHKLSDNELEKVLRESTDDRAVREAWRAGKQIGSEVAGQVLDVVRLRNEAAQRLGFANHYALSLTTSEIDETWLFELLDELAVRSEDHFRKLKAEIDEQLVARFQIPAAALRPWHYGDPFFQRPPRLDDVNLDPFFTNLDPLDLAVRTYDSFGMEVRPILERSDLYARDGKNQHAFCLDLDRQEDIRILCNLEPTLRWNETMLHELGHGVYDRYISPDLPFLLRTHAHIMMTEAIALLMGRLTLQPRWLADIAGLPAAEADRLGDALQRQQQRYLTVFLRWVLVITNFERAMYRDPEQDLNTLWWDLVEKYQHLTRPDDSAAPTWAAKIHLALYPVYYQNYQLGDLIASQFNHHIRTHFGGLVGSVEAGRWLIDAVFAPGNSQDWQGRLQAATGESLNLGYFMG